MSYLCFLGAAALSGTVVYHEWQRRNHHVTVSNLILALEHVDPVNPNPTKVVQNAKAIIEWSKRPAEEIPAEHMDEVLLLRRIAQQVKTVALKQQGIGYIEQVAVEYKSLINQATDVMVYISPQWTLALKQAL